MWVSTHFGKRQTDMRQKLAACLHRVSDTSCAQEAYHPAAQALSRMRTRMLTPSSKAFAVDPNPKDWKYKQHWATRNVIIRPLPGFAFPSEIAGFEQYPRKDKAGNDVYQFTFDLLFDMLRSTFGLQPDSKTHVLVLAQVVDDYLMLYCDKCTDAIVQGEYFIFRHSAAVCRSMHGYACGPAHTATEGVTWVDGKAAHTLNMPFAKMECASFWESLEEVHKPEDSHTGGAKQASLRELLGAPAEGQQPKKRSASVAEHPHSGKKGKSLRKPKVDGRGDRSSQTSEPRVVGGNAARKLPPSDPSGDIGPSKESGSRFAVRSTDGVPRPFDEEMPSSSSPDCMYKMFIRMDKKLDYKIDSLEVRMENKIDALDNKIDAVDNKIELWKSEWRTAIKTWRTACSWSPRTAETGTKTTTKNPNG